MRCNAAARRREQVTARALDAALDKLMAEAEKLATRFSTAPTKGLARTKQALYASSGNSLEQQLELERALQQELGFGHDYREGVAAFMEKRSPTFTVRLVGWVKMTGGACTVSRALELVAEPNRLVTRTR